MSNAKKTSLRKLSFLGFGRQNTSSDGVGNEVAEVRLDDECAKVFAMDSEDRFNVAELHTNADCSAPRVYSEQDYQAVHRKKSYPHIHIPLKAIHSRSLKKRVAASPTKAESEHLEDSAPPSEYTDSFPKITDSDTTGQLSPTDGQDDDDTGALSTDTEGPVTDPANYDESPFETSPERRVQFTIDGISAIPEDPEHTPDPAETKKKRKHSRHHHAHHSRFRKYSLQEDPEWRKKSGAEKIQVASGQAGRRVSIQPEDTVLEEVDQDILDSHRSDDPRALRRHKTSISSRKASVVHISRKEGGKEHLQHVLSPTALKKMYDHSPHEVFVQLDELTGVGSEQEWKETARWIKYEEDLEEGSDRWGRPHVASLSFHSLLNLRRCLETGLVILDMEEKDFPGITYRVTEQMVIDELIKDIDKSVVMRCLLLRHRYVNEHDRGFKFSKRHYASYTSLQNLSDTEKKKAVGHHGENGKNGVQHTCDLECRLVHPDNHTIVDMKEETYATSSVEDMKKAQNDSHILRRIPVGAEAISVLVGTVDFLEQPTTAFVRLAEGCLMPSIMEVNIPVRFLFILLGPTGANLDYHEIGRSISTLMSNQQFHKIAYKADNRKALLSAINEFLDDSIVLPPGDWERQALLPFEELKAKSEAIRRRKQKALGKVDVSDDGTKKLLAVSDDGKKPPFQDPLKRTHRLFGGLINDLRRRYPFFKSDVVDGLNAQCAAAAIFMYFAALSGAITFGGLMSDKTHNQIGISETLIATSVAGIIFAVFSGQPLVIVGSTGPLLLFDESLFQFCKANGIEYLTTRVYIGLWLGIIALIVASLEGSVFVKLFTRFTEEIFSALISLLYIVESMMKLFYVYGRHPLMGDYCSYAVGVAVDDAVGNDTSSADFMDLNDTMVADASSIVENNSTMCFSNTAVKFADANGPMYQPNTALFCTILALGTFAIAYYLRLFRNSQFLGRSARRALGDFGVPIAIVIMVFLDYIVPDTYTEKLSVPEGLSPSNPAIRGWLIDPSGSNQPLEFWVIFAAGIPAMLVYILLFMETHISELIIDKKERKLRKGSGFHLDIVLICLLNVGCGFLGTPWICAATVRSVAHVSAVTVMSRTHAPGDKPHLVEVKEQRVSAFAVATLVGLSVLMSPLLRLVPMSVLFGVFLYMGISSMDGIQFFDRMKLFLMPVKHHPHASYVRKVQTLKMHLFTFIQAMCLVVLWLVKSTKISLAFPFFLLLMIPLRAQLRYLFTPAELRALDGDQPDADDDEPDFYAEAPLPG